MSHFIFIDTNKEIGVRIYNFRTEKNMSGRELAEATELTERYITDAEKGKVNVGYNQICRISSALGIKRCDLVGEEEIDGLPIAADKEVKYIRTKPKSKIAKSK